MLGSAVAFVPAVLAMLTNYTECTAGVAGLNTLFDALAVIAQLSAVILWPFLDPTMSVIHSIVLIDCSVPLHHSTSWL